LQKTCIKLQVFHIAYPIAGFEPIAYADFFVDVVEVAFYGVFADFQCRCNIEIGGAVFDQTENLPLPLGQLYIDVANGRRAAIFFQEMMEQAPRYPVFAAQQTFETANQLLLIGVGEKQAGYARPIQQIFVFAVVLGVEQCCGQWLIVGVDIVDKIPQFIRAQSVAVDKQQMVSSRIGREVGNDGAINADFLGYQGCEQPRLQAVVQGIQRYTLYIGAC